MRVQWGATAGTAVLLCLLLAPPLCLGARTATRNPRVRVSASLRLHGAHLTARGRVRLPRHERRGIIRSWRVVIQAAGARRGSWRALASRRLTPRPFAMSWEAAPRTSVLVARVAVVSQRTVLAATRPRRLVVRRHASPSGRPPRASRGCGGEVPPPKPGGGSWTCTFDDEFDASTGDADSLNRAWWIPQDTHYSEFETGALPILASVCYEDSPQTISVADGVLRLTVRKAPSPTMCGGFLNDYIGGMVSTYQRFNQQYGRFEVRALLPAATTRGLQETLWLWPVKDTLYGAWPASGEIDFAEFYSNAPGLDIPYIHYNFAGQTADSATGTNVVTITKGCPIAQGQFNDYAVTWTPGNLTITVNGATCLVDNYLPDGGISAPAPFDQPFFIVMTQALGFGANAFNPIQTPLPATTSIDYVRVWK